MSAPTPKGRETCPIYKGKQPVKIVRWMLCIVALSAMIIGCGEETPEFVTSYGDDLHDLDVYTEWWQIVYINGKKSHIAYGSIFSVRQVR